MLRMLAHAFVTGAHLQLAETALFFYGKVYGDIYGNKKCPPFTGGHKKAQLL